jgi:RHS repeat-associated protein
LLTREEAYCIGTDTDFAGNKRNRFYEFTGKERDAESGLDNFGARFDSSSFGRFTSPDPVFVHMLRVRSNVGLPHPLRFSRVRILNFPSPIAFQSR